MSPTGEYMPRERPDVTTGFTEAVKTGCGKLFVTVNWDDEGICEVFAKMTAGCSQSQTEAITRLASLGLRSGVKPQEIVRQLVGISCPMPHWHNGKQVLSCADAIAKVLQKAIDMGQAKDENALRLLSTVDGRAQIAA